MPKGTHSLKKTGTARSQGMKTHGLKITIILEMSGY